MSKYDLLMVLRAVEVCYTVDLNPCPVTVFIDYFCMKYKLDRKAEERRIRNMLLILSRQGKFEIHDNKLFMENMLTSNIKLEITG